MLAPRQHVMLAAVANGKIYAVGGTELDENAALSTVEEYDPEADAWTTKASMPTPRWDFGLVAASNGRLYAIGGMSGIKALDVVEEYDPDLDRWTTRRPLSRPRYGLGVAASNGKVYAVGGLGANTAPATTVEEYDPVVDIWTPKTPLLMPITGGVSRGGVAATNGKLYAVWYSNDRQTWQVQEYDPATDEDWVVGPASKTTTADIEAALTQVGEGKAYAVGGRPFGTAGMSGTVEVYDTLTNRWTRRTSLPSMPRAFGLAAASGKVYIVGGSDGSNTLRSVYRYDPIADTAPAVSIDAPV